MNKHNRAEKKMRAVDGGITLEAAIAIPIFIFAIAIMINIMTMIGVQIRVRELAFESVREASGKAALFVDGESTASAGAITTAMIDSSLKQKISATELTSSINGGVSGVNIISSEILQDNSKIKLNIEYSLKTPFSYFNVSDITVSQCVETYAWLGEDYMDYRENTKYVYVAEHGSVYHLSPHCSYLHSKLYVSQLSDMLYRRNASGAKYYACKRCSKGSISATVFYTQYGNRYHSDRECSEIHHDYKKVPLSEVEGTMPKCSKE